MKARTRHVCPYCGSDSIDGEAWVNINDDTVGSYSGSDLYCNYCEEHIRGTCTVDVETGKCVGCWFSGSGGGKHDEFFKPLENMSPPPTEEELIEQARRKLIDARELLKQAGTPKSTERVRLALSSVKGALRNASYRKHRPERKRIKRAPRLEVVQSRRTR